MSVGWEVPEEFEGAKLKDSPRTKRLVRIEEALSKNPQCALPKAMKDEAGREGAYRFFSNKSVNRDATLESHFTQTVGRASEHQEFFAVHDGTEFHFPSEGRKGDGGETFGSQGFLSFVSLLLPTEECRGPLGLVGWRKHHSRIRPLPTES